MGFNSKNYWENRYRTGGNSGKGSYGQLSNFKTSVINDIIEKNGLESAIEFGCGDGNQLKNFNFKSYTGCDVSETILKKCNEIYKNDNSKNFIHINDLANNRKYDCTLSLDVIYHLIEDEVFNKYIDDLFNYSEKNVIIYTFRDDAKNINFSSHIKYRDVKTIEDRIEGWELSEIIPNPYPKESYADFYIYGRKNR